MAIEREKVSISRTSGGIKRDVRRIDRSAPDFESIFSDDGNPLLDLPDLGDIQSNSDQEISAVQLEIERNRAAFEERFRITADPEFFFCVCFQSRDQKEEFLKNIGWFDDLGDKYLNGLDVARRLDIPVTIVPLEPRKLRGGVEKFRKDFVIGDKKEVISVG